MQISVGRMHRRAFWGMALAFLVLGRLGLWTLLYRAPPVDARMLLQAAYEPPGSGVDSEHVVHFKTVVYQRARPDATEPPDPYHRPVLGLYSDTYEVEHWIRGGGIPQQRSTARDRRSGELLFDHVRNGDFYGVYHAATGYAFTLRLPPTSRPSPTATPVGSTPNPIPPGLQVVGTVPSPWGRPAWVLRALEPVPSPSVAQERTPRGAPLPFQRPYLADLSPTRFEYEWLIDQATGRMVRYEWWAVTASGRVLIERVEEGPPEILPISAVPADWLAFPPAGVPVREAGSAGGAGPELAAVTLEQALAEADFAVFLPEVSDRGLGRTVVRFRPSAEPAEDRRWRFDIEEAWAHGLALEVIYLPDRSDDPHALAVIQGPREWLVPRMRETPPNWAHSHPVQVSVGTDTVTVWVAGGGVFDAPPPRVVGMLEVEGTFLFIVDQGYSEAQLLEFVRTLHRVK